MLYNLKSPFILRCYLETFSNAERGKPKADRAKRSILKLMLLIAQKFIIGREGAFICHIEITLVTMVIKCEPELEKYFIIIDTDKNFEFA